jgi:hypothetical protein
MGDLTEGYKEVPQDYVGIDVGGMGPIQSPSPAPMTLSEVTEPVTPRAGLSLESEPTQGGCTWGAATN